MKKYIILTLIVALTLTSCGKKEKKVTKYYSTGTVQTGSIDLNKSFIGYVESENTIPLSTKVGGRVSSIYVNIGDTVHVGKLLAELDGSEAKIGYKTSENIIFNLQALKESTSLMFDSQIKAMESKVEQARAGNIGTQMGLQDTKNITNSQLKTAESSVNQANISLELAKTTLEKTKLIYETEKQHIYKNTINSITNSVILDTNILNFIDSLLGITETNRDKNDSYEDYLSGKDSKHLKTSKEEFIEVNKLFIEYKKLYEEEIENKVNSEGREGALGYKTPDNETIKEIALKGIQIAEKIKVLLSSTYDVLDNSIENVYLPQTTIDNYKSKVSEMGKDIELSLLSVSGNYLLGLKGSIENLESFNTTNSMQIALLEKQVALAEQNVEIVNNTYEQYKSISTGKINEISTQNTITDLNIQEAMSGLNALKKQKETSLNEIQTKLSEAFGQQSSAGVMISNSKIISPISGIIIDKLYEEGQVVGGGIPILVVADPNNIKVKVGVDDDIVRNIKVGDVLNIDIEGNKNSVSGTILNIFPSKEKITKKNIVEIKINTSENIKIGSMAKVYFEKNSEYVKSSLIIPTNSIVQQFMLPGVYVIENGKVKFKNIQILEQDETNAEISGLEVGEIIIIEGKENIYDGEEIVNNK